MKISGTASGINSTLYGGLCSLLTLLQSYKVDVKWEVQSLEVNLKLRVY